MKTLRHYLIAPLITLLLVLPFTGSLGQVSVSAQATINQTTLAAAVSTTTQSRFNLASVSTLAVGQIMYIDREAVQITALPTSTLVDVSRGVRGTAAATHASGANVITGPANYFYANEPSGSCTATGETALPHVSLPTGSIYDCKNSLWVRLMVGGYPVVSPAQVSPTYISIAVSAAIAIQPGVSFIGSGGALAMTLASPTLAQNGMVMYIIASTAQAHTVTYTAGFGGGTTARDVATFGGAINDELAIIAVNGTWWVLSTRNVTLG